MIYEKLLIINYDGVDFVKWYYSCSTNTTSTTNTINKYVGP